MIYILFSIICSVSVAVLFKIIKRKQVEIFPIIHLNYLLAIVLCYFFLDGNFYVINAYKDNIYLYIILGALLPTLFLIFNKSIQQVGIIKTDIAQRFSLIIPILVSVFIWQQTITLSKTLGILIGFIALFLILNRSKKAHISTNNFLPLLVLLGYGLADVGFKKIALILTIPYTSSLLLVFTIAFILATIIAIFKKNIESYNIVTLKWGIILGILNFTNIYTYIKAHQVLKDNPTVVFMTMNLGVIIASVIVGFYLFKETINKINLLGIILAILAIFLILNY